MTVSEINDLTWCHVGVIEPHAAMPTTGPEPLRCSVRLASSCATCGEGLFAYCPDDFTGEPHTCPYLTERRVWSIGAQRGE